MKIPIIKEITLIEQNQFGYKVNVKWLDGTSQTSHFTFEALRDFMDENIGIGVWVTH